jgi:glucose-1-phosphate cytidylyltransferase
VKVVFFCGGYGMRLFPSTEAIPKPLVTVGDTPILWNLMKYYSHYGYKDFILCLGYKGNEIKKYFLNFNEALVNDFVMTRGGKKLEVLNKDIEEWTITFVDTGLHSNIGERLVAVKSHLQNEERFMANYSDALTDLHLSDLVQFAQNKDKIGCFITVNPPHSFHVVESDNGNVTDLHLIEQSNIRINGGFFIFKKQIFDYIKPGEELVLQPFQRLIKDKELVTYKYDGFWASMDTYKDKSRLDDMATHGKALWKVWK